MQAFKVYLEGKQIDTIFYGDSTKITKEEVRDSLINHDRYEHDFVVKKVRKKCSIACSDSGGHKTTFFKCGYVEKRSVR